MRNSGTIGLMAMLAGAPALPAQRAGVVLALPASARAAGAGDASPLATGASALFYGSAALPRSARSRRVPARGLATRSSRRWRLPCHSADRHSALGVQSLDYGSADEIVPDPLTGGLRGTATGDRVGASEFALTAGVGPPRGRLARRRGGDVHVAADRGGERPARPALTPGQGMTLRGWDVSAAAQHLGGTLGLARCVAAGPHVSWGGGEPGVARRARIAARGRRVSLGGGRRRDGAARR